MRLYLTSDIICSFCDSDTSYLHQILQWRKRKHRALWFASDDVHSSTKGARNQEGSMPTSHCDWNGHSITPRREHSSFLE